MNPAKDKLPKLTMAAPLFIVILFAFPPASAELPAGITAKADPLRAEEAFVPSLRRQDDGDYTLSWAIAPGYYLYRDKIGVSMDGIPLSYQLPPADEIINDEFFGESEIYRHQLRVKLLIQDKGETASIAANYQGCWDGGLCYPPQTHTFGISEGGIGNAVGLAGDGLVNDGYVHYLQNHSLGAAVLIFLGLGVLLAFTPCVLPMIPILSGIIAGDRQAPRSSYRSFILSSAYVLTMAFVYSLLGLVAGLSGANLYSWFQKPQVIVPFALVFVLLAASMFGWITLRLPGGWQNSLYASGNSVRQGRLVGAMLLGGLSALIVSPCVTPALIGALLFIAQSGSALTGASILFAMAFGMGLPLILIGTSLGRFLPKPGPAMLIVNTLFGFLLLATAVWLLDRVVASVWSMSLAALVLMFAAWRIYRQSAALAGKTQFAIRSSATAPLTALGLLFIASVATGGNQFIAPWAHWLNNETRLSADSFSFTRLKTNDALDQALAQSKAADKATMVYYSAKWCVSCRELDAYVFSQPQVQAALSPYSLIKVDVTSDGDEEKTLLKRFDLFGPPSILFFDRHGREIESQRVYGYMSKNQFIAHLEKNQIGETSQQAAH